MGFQINRVQVSNLEYALRQTDPRYEPCIDCECDCQKNKGTWKRVPFLRSVPYPSSMPGPTGLGTAYAFDAIPIGVKIYIGADVTATIGGTLECKCADKPNCKVETDVNINLTVPISFPVTQTAVGIAARFVPWVGWAYTAASFAYYGERFREMMANLSWAFEPALRVVQESADLICEGRFDPSTLQRHVLDIIKDIELE